MNCWFLNDCVKANTEICNEWCDKYLLYSALANQSQIPKRYINCFLDTFPDKNSNQYKITERYISILDSLIAEGTGIYLHGGVGTGKTTMAITIANEFMKSKIWTSNLEPQAIYIVIPEFLERIKSGFDNPDEELTELLTNLEKAPIVLFDDIGAERPSEWVRERLFSIISSRYNNQLVNIFTSNLTLYELEASLGERIASRISGMCHIVEIGGKDHRRG